MAAIARDEEAWWDAELARLLPGLLLPGKPVRGGGRAVSTHPSEGSAGMELDRLRSLSSAVRRRVLRAAAQQLGCSLNFDETERLMAMVAANAPRKQQFANDLRAERTARELRLIREASSGKEPSAPETFLLPIPGEVTGLGVTLRATLRDHTAHASGAGISQPIPPAILRTPRPGDRVHIARTRAPKPLKEIFERMGVPADQRKTWPVAEWQGRIVWMQGASVVATVPFIVVAVGRPRDSAV
jgi:tRNA(Ile)-lysidine synthase